MVFMTLGNCENNPISNCNEKASSNDIDRKKKTRKWRLCHMSTLISHLKAKFYAKFSDERTITIITVKVNIKLL